MPELPEVETVRRGLERTLCGRRFDAVTVGRERVARRTSRKELRDGLTGARVVRVDRRGKYLLLELDSNSVIEIVDRNGRSKSKIGLEDRVQRSNSEIEIEIEIGDWIRRSKSEIEIGDRTRR